MAYNVQNLLSYGWKPKEVKDDSAIEEVNPSTHGEGTVKRKYHAINLIWKKLL